jgi:hypothetical protein
VPAGHALPHAPQLYWSLARSRHVPSHGVMSPGHESVQTPPSHVWPAGQRMPQPPQSALLERMSTHTPPQSHMVDGHPV